MAGFYSDYEQRVSSALIQHLKSDYQLLVAENLIKLNGLQWSSPNSSDVYIIGPNKDVVEFAIESLESLLDKNRNPLCSLENGRTRLDFKGALAKNIIKSQQILKEKTSYIFIYESTYNNDVTVSCKYDYYSKIRKTIDQIINSTSSTGSSSLLDKNVVEGKSQYNGCPGSPSTPLYHFQHSTFQYIFKTKNIQVYVYKASITDVTGIDAIVNAADEYLRHERGVSFAICEADGYSMKKQCLELVRKHGRIPIGQNVVTKPGKLKHLKTIIHAVGPCWDDYSEKKQCAMALHETIINVLKTANTHCIRKIAFPPVSAGKFKVPKNVCAQMYIKAIMDYSRDVKPNNVTEIHFVDIKDDILKAIREAHENCEKSPELLDFKNLDFKNALGYAPQQGGARARTPSLSDRQSQGHHGGASYLPCEVQYLDTETMPFGGQQKIFKVKKRLTVRIYNGSIVKVSRVDALVCSVGTDFKGGKLAEAFELAGGAVYTKELSNLKRTGQSVGDVAVLLEPGNLRSKHILLAIMESKRITTLDENTARKLKDMYVKILETANTYGMKTIALPLLGSGFLVKDAANLECCCNSLFDGLTSSQVVRGNCVEDIQVVNIHPEVTDAIVRVFHQRSVQSQTKSKYGGKVGESNSSGERTPKLKKPGLPLHHTQSLKLPNDYKKGDGKKEKERCASVHVPSSPGFSQDKDGSYNQVHGSGSQWNDRNEVKKKKRTQSSSSLSSQDEEDAGNMEPSQNEKLCQKQTQGNQPVSGDGESWLGTENGDGESWLGTENGGKPGNLTIYDVDADKLKTLNKCKIEKSVDTCSSDTCDKAAKESLGCDHKFCEICLIPMKRNPVCTICSQKSVEMTLGATSTNPGKITKMPETSSSSDTCIICMEKLDTRHKLLCGHDSFHKKCIDEAFVYKEVCPLCGKIIGTVTGSQPDGKMKITDSKRSLPGYEHCGSIEIFYEFQDGIQSGDHPHPGKPYKGTRRKAYLPGNHEGQTVLKMLKVAFDRKLVFTIGESRTTGKTDTVTWNDIHHKTRIDGGPSNFGYPDPDYLRRVREELKAKGITEADI
ncbi:hypothetical protein ACJMK2_006834 [Sinanodonta woodiana]|uniref:RING-type E3 ubiquitin transferase n=1 Tax=Sinanodonta woodiana TaxID=1069815 RepID=A0ABD3VW20_SINWO